MIRKLLEKEILEALVKAGIANVAADITRTDPKFGDFTTNVSLKIAKATKGPEGVNGSKVKKNPSLDIYQSPMEFARILADSLQKSSLIKKLEVKEPGFINFWIHEKIWQKEVEELLKKRVFETDFSHKKVIVEFTDPNPFKEFHIGHLYSNSVGEAISRLFEAVGANVKRANYQGDVGMHVAKSIWGMREKVKSQKSKVKSLEGKPLKERIKFLGEAYAVGAKAFEEDAKAKEEITGLNKEIYEKGEAMEEYRLGKKWSLEHFEEIYARLGTKFDFYYFESEVGGYGAKLVHEYLGSVFEESEGAIIFPGEKYGLHNRVFINSLGLPTYEAKELGLAPRKFEDFEYDVSVIITGNEINEYFKVLLSALSQIAPNLAEKTKHIGHGMVRMPAGKMSSRLGNVLSGEWLLDEAKKKAKKVVDEKGLVSDLEDLAETVAVGAVKYSLLKNNIGQDTKFSFEESISLEGNSGPYLQYTHARCRSVLEKAIGNRPAEGEVRKWRQKAKVYDWTDLSAEEDLLLRALGHFEDVVVACAKNFSPSSVAGFLFEVAQKYNLLYNNLPILKAGAEQSARRLFLTRSTAEILKRGLNLLGINAPDKM